MGKVQKKILDHLQYMGGQACITPIMRIDNLAPYDWSEIGLALDRLIKRKVIRKINSLGVYEIIYK